MSKINNFVENVSNLLTQTERDTVKETIGDSVDNNRTVTVSQFIRYLKVTNQYTYAYNVKTAYNKLKPRLVKLRRYNNRTDAFDVNEFLTVLTVLAVNGDPTEKQVLSRSLI